MRLYPRGEQPVLLPKNKLLWNEKARFLRKLDSFKGLQRRSKGPRRVKDCPIELQCQNILLSLWLDWTDESFLTSVSTTKSVVRPRIVKIPKSVPAFDNYLQNRDGDCLGRNFQWRPHSSAESLLASLVVPKPGKSKILGFRAWSTQVFTAKIGGFSDSRNRTFCRFFAPSWTTYEVCARICSNQKRPWIRIFWILLNEGFSGRNYPTKRRDFSRTLKHSHFVGKWCDFGIWSWGAVWGKRDDCVSCLWKIAWIFQRKVSGHRFSKLWDAP